MNVSLILGSLAVVGSVAALWWGFTGERVPRVTIDPVGGVRSATTDMRVARLQLGVGERAVDPLLVKLGQMLRRFTPQGWVGSLEQRLQHAGTPLGWTVERVLVAKAAAASFGAVFGVLWLLTDPSGLTFVLAVLLALAGYLGPDFVLRQRATERQEAIKRTLSDTVDQIVIVVEAGLGLDAAIGRVSATTSGPLADELARVVQDARVGMPRADALGAMAERVQVPELRHLVVALVQSEKLGVPVVQALRVQAQELRIKRRQFVEEAAGKLPVKILFPTLFCVFPALFIVILGPAVIEISDTLNLG